MTILVQWTALHAGLYCLANAALYVMPLYAIPARVRKLPRDNVTHVRNLKIDVTDPVFSPLVFSYLIRLSTGCPL